MLKKKVFEVQTLFPFGGISYDNPNNGEHVSSKILPQSCGKKERTSANS